MPFSRRSFLWTLAAPALAAAQQQPTYSSEVKVVNVLATVRTKRGEIVRKTVLQSLGPAIDNQCLAALESWHFRPATHNGTPIPSKQDAIFPFKARG